MARGAARFQMLVTGGEPLAGVREYTVHSETQSGVEYTVRLGGGVAECSCPDYLNRALKAATYRSPWVDWCKHLRKVEYHIADLPNLTWTERDAIMSLEQRVTALEKHGHAVEFQGRLVQEGGPSAQGR